jgi:hypothetical protein
MKKVIACGVAGARWHAVDPIQQHPSTSKAGTVRCMAPQSLIGHRRSTLAPNAATPAARDIFPSSRYSYRVTDPSARSTPANRLRFIGSGVLVLGLTAAYVFYRVRTQSHEPTMDDLLPGYSERRARQTSILMGGFVVSLLQGAESLKEPLTQAWIIAGVSVLVAILCFRVAWLMDRPAEEEQGTDFDDR